MRLRALLRNLFHQENKGKGPGRKALNLATTETRKPKRTYEQKLAGNIKQEVWDKVGPLENNSGNIILDGFHMAEVLNKYFSSVFVLYTKFEGNKSEHFGQLFVTHEMIAKKIKRWKIINHLELMGYHQNCLRKLLNKSIQKGY